MNSEKLTSNDFTLSSKRNTESKVGRFSRTALGNVVGGIGASLVVIVAMVEGVMIGVGVGRGVMIGVGVGRGAIEDEAVVKMDSTAASVVEFSMLVTNDDTDELSC
nr:hypothetical protein [Tanacetum cinerariifolium]